MSEPTKILMVFLLVVVATMTSRVSCAEAPSPSPQDEKNIVIILPSQVSNPNITECWNGLLESEGCIADTVRNIFSFQFHVSPKCCKVLDGIGERCLGNPPFFGLIKALCALATE